MDENARIKRRIKATRDLYKLWQKLRNEGYSVYEAEDYTDNEQAPYHLYYIEKGHGAPVEVLYKNKTESELNEEKALGFKPFKQEIEFIRY